MPRMTFESFSVETPPGWEDVTDLVEGDDPPTTLGREEGVGALQFSIALYEDGELPDPSPEDLVQLLHMLAQAQGFAEPVEVVSESGPLRLAAGSFSKDGEYVRIWQLSDGSDFALVTYTCELGMDGPEVDECEQIVRTLSFR